MRNVNQLLTKFFTWNYRKKLALFAGWWLLLTFFGYYAHINALQRQLTISSQEQQTLAQQLKKQQLLLNKIPTATHLLTIPTQSMDATWIAVLKNLAKIGAKHQIIINSLQPQSSDKTTAKYLINITAAGKYANIVYFLYELSVTAPPTIIENIILQPGPENNENSDLIQLQAKLISYCLNQQQISSKLPPLKTHLTNIFVPNNLHPIPPTKSLFAWSNRDLRFLGTVQQANKNWGIIIDPMGIVYHLTVGDHIGLKQAKIVAINARGIFTEKNLENILLPNGG